MATLEQLKLKAEATGKTVSPSYIRSVVAMNNTGLHTFGIIAGQNPSFTSYNIERRLNQNDAFIVTHYGFFIRYAATAAGLATAVRYTYPNPASLIPADTTPTNAEVAAVEALYNGALGVTVGQANILPALDMARFRKAPRTQQYVGAAGTTGALLMGWNPADSQDPNDGFMPVYPFNLTIDGGRQINWSVSSVAATALSNVYLEFEFRGYQITQGAGITI